MIKLFDTKVNIEIRLFFILGWTALIANTVGFLSNLIFYGMAPDTLFYGICAICIFFIGIIEKKTGNDSVAARIILLLVNLVEFPTMYYLYGSGRIVYMVLGVLGVFIFSRNKWRVILAVLTMCFDVGIIIFSVLHPANYITVTPESDLGAGIASFLIVMISLMLILILIVRQYETQNQELVLMTEELKKMATRDPLTKLYNRRYLTEYLEERMARNNETFAVVLLDLDDFKDVNDTYGHVYGDEVLQNFAACIQNSTQGQGISARFGGEEFMMVLDTIREEEIKTLMEHIRLDFEKFSLETKGIRLTFSGGVEIFKSEDRITQLFNAADEKLYHAKEQGKNRVIYS